MFKKILVPALNASLDPKALKLAVDAARLFDGHVDCLFTHPDAIEIARYLTPMGPETAVYSGQLAETIMDADKQCAARARQLFDGFCARERHDRDEPVAATFCEASGNACEQAIQQGFYHDLLVLGRPSREDLTLTGAIDVIASCGRPVMLAPNGPLPATISTVVIAWKESAQAARAVAAALPLLAKASKIDIIGVAESADGADRVLRSAEKLAEYLRGHGLAPQAGHLAATDRPVGDVLLEAATGKLHGSLLVMGGYQHSRAREFVFGGVTRRVLHSAPIPILLAH
jgi:nucleotide-binding universal stress UspA family protein